MLSQTQDTAFSLIEKELRKVNACLVQISRNQNQIASNQVALSRKMGRIEERLHYMGSDIKAATVKVLEEIKLCMTH